MIETSWSTDGIAFHQKKIIANKLKIMLTKVTINSINKSAFAFILHLPDWHHHPGQWLQSLQPFVLLHLY